MTPATFRRRVAELLRELGLADVVELVVAVAVYGRRQLEAER